MAIIVPDVGKEAQLDLILAENYTLRLFTNDVISGLTDAQVDALTAGSFTEATFTGYSSKALTGGSWTTTPNPAESTVGTYAQQTFTRTSTGTPQVIRGYYVTRTTGGALRWFEYFPGPITVTNNGESIPLTPTYPLDDDRNAMSTARGIVAKQTSTSNGSSISSDGLSDFALNDVSVDSTRLYRVHLASDVFLSDTARWLVSLRVNGVDTLRLGDFQSVSGAQNTYISSSVLWEPATGTPDLTVYADETSGTATFQFQASSSAPRQFWVEDVGPR